jgi:DNA-binding NarL/FixJ family response regulator
MTAPRYVVHGTNGPRGSYGPPDQLNIDIAIERVRWRIGDPPLLNVAERKAVVVALTEAGWTSGRIATALGLAQRTVGRLRSANRTAA